MRKQMVLSFVLVSTVLSGIAGCSDMPRRSEAEARFCADNEILTYDPVDFDKTVITVGIYAPGHSKPLELAIEAAFPDVDIVILNQVSITDVEEHAKHPGVQKDLEDIVVTSYIKDAGISCSAFYDLSAEDFTSRYYQSVLNDLSVDGKLHQLPINNTVQGIFYNKSLFEAHGWEIPDTIDAFYTLCEEISAQGIRPFVPCFKYSPDGVGLGFSNRTVFSTVEKREQYGLFCSGQASCVGLLEPYFEALKNSMTKES